MRTEDLGYCVKAIHKGIPELSAFDKRRDSLELMLIDRYSSTDAAQASEDEFQTALDNLLQKHGWKIVRCRRILEEVINPSNAS